MAICLRRTLRKYSLLTYSTVSGQHALPSYIALPVKVSQNWPVPGMLFPSCPNQYDGEPLQEYSPETKKKDLRKNELTLLGNNFYCDKLYLLTLFEKDVLYCAKECQAYKKRERQKEIGSPFDKPSSSQLQIIYHKLCEDLPRIFQKPIDHNIYHENLIFENNIWGTTTIGVRNYLSQIAFLKVYVSVKYSSVKFEILKITTHTEDGSVRVRWRIRGVPGFKVIVLFWRQKVWRQKEIVEEYDGWFDGFSIFYVKGDGLIHKHVASKLMPNDSGSITRLKPTLAAKVALITGLTLNDFSASLLPEVDKFSEKKS